MVLESQKRKPGLAIAEGICWGSDLGYGRYELALFPWRTHRAYCAFEWHVNTL